jgi:hypothetical protein
MPVTGQSPGTISADTQNVKSEINPFTQEEQTNAQFGGRGEAGGAGSGRAAGWAR